MNLFLDTEFTNFMRPQLISLALVAEDGQEFYVELSDYDSRACSAYVLGRIVPLLDPGTAVSRIEAGARLGCWLEALGEGDAEHTVYVDYLTDWELLVDLIDGSLPTNISPEWINTYSALEAAATIKCTQQSRHDYEWFRAEVRDAYHFAVLEYLQHSLLKQHHALADARAARHGWREANKKILQHY